MPSFLESRETVGVHLECRVASEECGIIRHDDKFTRCRSATTTANPLDLIVTHLCPLQHQRPRGSVETASLAPLTPPGRAVTRIPPACGRSGAASGAVRKGNGPALDRTRFCCCSAGDKIGEEGRGAEVHKGGAGNEDRPAPTAGASDSSEGGKGWKRNQGHRCVQ